MRKMMIVIAVFAIGCACAFAQTDDPFAGVDGTAVTDEALAGASGGQFPDMDGTMSTQETIDWMAKQAKVDKADMGFWIDVLIEFIEKVTGVELPEPEEITVDAILALYDMLVKEVGIRTEIPDPIECGGGGPGGLGALGGWGPKFMGYLMYGKAKIILSELKQIMMNSLNIKSTQPTTSIPGGSIVTPQPVQPIENIYY